MILQVLLGQEVVELDAPSHTARLSDGTTLKYDQALVAPGGKYVHIPLAVVVKVLGRLFIHDLVDSPRTIPVPGMNSSNIRFLRDPLDANWIINNVDGKRVVIVGSSFIGT
jgi:hypothetical protein